MPPTSRRVLVAALALSLAALGLAACATPSPGTSPSIADTGSPSADAGEIGAAWLDDGRAVGVVTWGSSSCVPFAGEPMYDAATATVTVELTDPEGAACTRDYVPRGSLVSLPAGVSPAEDLQVVVTGTYAGSTALAGDAALTAQPGGMTEYLPSAGWYDHGGFLILTWGSSSCVPQLESAEATGADEVTATFVTPPADQVCTADMGPRVTVAGVADVPEDADVTLLIVGGGFADVEVPIAGKS